MNAPQPPTGSFSGRTMLWGAILTGLLGFIGLAIALFGDKTKRPSRLVGSGLAVGAWIILIAIIAIAATASGGSGNASTPARAQGQPNAASLLHAAATLTATVPKVRQLTMLAGTCTVDVVAVRRVCRGTVKNTGNVSIKSGNAIVLFATEAGSIDTSNTGIGDFDVRPLLPGGTSAWETSVPYDVDHVAPQIAFYDGDSKIDTVDGRAS